MRVRVLAVAALFIAAAAQDNNPCPSDYEYFSLNNKCYRVYKVNQTYYEARTRCLQDSATLASIHSREENDFVARMLTDESFLGMESATEDERNYVWIDGTPVEFVNWGFEEPSDHRDFQRDCVAIVGDNGDSKQSWRNLPCTYVSLVRLEIISQGYICAKPTQSNQCPQGYRLLRSTSKCYRLVKRRVSHSEAKRACENEGAALPSIKTPDENDFLADMVRAANVTSWIGLYAPVNFNEYEWVDGSPLNFTAWMPTEPYPSNNYVTENCVTMYGDSTVPGWRRKWNNVYCNAIHYGICKREPLPGALARLAESGSISKSSSTGVIVGVVVGVIAVLLIVLGLIIFIILRRRRQEARKHEELHRLSIIRRGQETSKAVVLEGIENSGYVKDESLYSGIEVLQVANFDPRFLIPYKRLGHVENILGTGNFGMVYRSVWRPSLRPNEAIEVACKQLHSLDDAEKQYDFLVEAGIMMSLRHRNVVGIHGLAFNAEKIPILVMELMGGGSLHSYLRNNRTSEHERLRFGKELASGMLYLHSCNLIHRDLATRNCM